MHDVILESRVLVVALPLSAVMASCTTGRVSTKSSGRYCVAGGPHGVSCKNSQSTEGISMHRFPKVKNDRTAADKLRVSAS